VHRRVERVDVYERVVTTREQDLRGAAILFSLKFTRFSLPDSHYQILFSLPDSHYPILTPDSHYQILFSLPDSHDPILTPDSHYQILFSLPDSILTTRFSLPGPILTTISPVFDPVAPRMPRDCARRRGRALAIEQWNQWLVESVLSFVRRQRTAD